MGGFPKGVSQNQVAKRRGTLGVMLGGAGVGWLGWWLTWFSGSWPLMGWKDCFREVDQGQMARRGGTLGVLLPFFN